MLGKRVRSHSTVVVEAGPGTFAEGVVGEANEEEVGAGAASGLGWTHTPS